MEMYMLNENEDIYAPLSAVPKMKIMGMDENILKNTINKPSLASF